MSYDVKSCINDITHCAICDDDFVNPKALPCMHSFCQQCLERLCISAPPSTVVPCPKCRAYFKIPPTGVAGLPNNFDLKKLTDAKRSEKYCTTHDEELLKLFCFDCGSSICIVCSLVGHAGHRHKRHTDAVSELKRQIEDHQRMALARRDELQMEEKKLKKTKSDFNSQLASVERSIHERITMMENYFQAERSKLLDALQTVRVETLQEIGKRMQHNESSWTAINNFVAKSQGACSRPDEMMTILTDIQKELQKVNATHDTYRAPTVSYSEDGSVLPLSPGSVSEQTSTYFGELVVQKYGSKRRRENDSDSGNVTGDDSASPRS